MEGRGTKNIHALMVTVELHRREKGGGPRGDWIDRSIDGGSRVERQCVE